MKDGALHHRTRDLTGQSFGMLTATGPAHSNGKKRSWHFLCQCGASCTKVGTDIMKEIKRGGTPNCGCVTRQLIGKANTHHGMSKHPTYAVWRSMLARCTNPSHPAWPNYGGRGITVCDTWQNSFTPFWADMGPTYSAGLDLDRKDNDGPYSPENCHWVTRRANTMNKRNTVRAVDIPEIARETGISTSTLYYRLHNGWPIDQLRRKPHPSNRSTTS